MSTDTVASASMATSSNSSSTKYIICYHYPCPDGIFGALGAYLYFQEHNLLSSVTWLPLTVYSKEPERITKLENIISLVSSSSSSNTTNTTPSTTSATNLCIYLIDFSGGTNFLNTACKLANRVILIDHHKTAAEDVASNPDLLKYTHFEQYIDMHHSGATLSHAYFTAVKQYSQTHHTSEIGKNLTLSYYPTNTSTGVDQLYAYIEDNDLFKHLLPSSKEFTAGFHSLGYEFDANKNPNIFTSLLQLDCHKLIDLGKQEIEKQDTIINQELSTSFIMNIPCTTTNTILSALAIITQYPDYRSAAGNRLAEKSANTPNLAPVGIIAYEEKGMGNDAQIMYKVSLRSLGEYDTTPYSRQYGGGGHRNASSFVISKDIFSSWCK